ncbi:MAG: shikimate kinase [Geitlerinemataceae cyanobacterium]
MSDSGKLLAKGLKGINVYLVGMMGAGKSTIAKLLARQLGYRCLDTDTIVEQVSGKTIVEIFESEGEAGFRDLESQVLEQVAAFQRTVVSTGGGIVLRDRNWGQMRQGSVLWIDVPIEDLFGRLKGNSTRPLLNDPDPKGKLVALMIERRERYGLADARITSTNAEPPNSTTHNAIEALIQAIKPQIDPPLDSNLQ